MSDSNVSTPTSGRSIYSEGGAVETRLIYEATVSVFLQRETDRPDPEWQSLDGGISTLGIYQSFHPEYPFRLLAISVQSNETVLDFWVTKAVEYSKTTPRFMQLTLTGENIVYGLSFKFANDADDFIDILDSPKRKKNKET